MYVVSTEFHRLMSSEYICPIRHLRLLFMSNHCFLIVSAQNIWITKDETYFNTNTYVRKIQKLAEYDLFRFLQSMLIG